MNHNGQSTFEFLLVFGFAIGLMFLFVHTAMTFTSGYHAHYATFMASRTYLVWDRQIGNPDQEYQSTDTNSAFATSKRVFDNYKVNIFGIYDSNGEFSIIQSNLSGTNNLYEFTGAKYKYTQPLSLMGFLGGKVNATMISESFLGKEPSRGECFQRIRDAMSALNIPNNDRQDELVTAYDNGC